MVYEWMLVLKLAGSGRCSRLFSVAIYLVLARLVRTGGLLSSFVSWYICEAQGLRCLLLMTILTFQGTDDVIKVY